MNVSVPTLAAMEKGDPRYDASALAGEMLRLQDKGKRRHL